MIKLSVSYFCTTLIRSLWASIYGSLSCSGSRSGFAHPQLTGTERKNIRKATQNTTHDVVRTIFMLSAL